MRVLTAALLSLIAAYGCSAARPREDRVSLARSTDVPAPSAGPPSSAKTVASPPAPAAPENPLDVKPSCRGAALSFDTEESEQDCLIPNTGSHELPPSPAPHELDVSASVADKSIAPGGTTAVIVTMTNKTKAPLLVYVELTCDDEPLFPFTVLDAHKKRVDLITHKNCDTNTFGCTRRVIRIVLEPGGSMQKKRSFTAKVTRIVADCGEVPAGSMKRGSYVLRVVTGLRDGANAVTGHQPRRTVETSLVVK